MAMDDPKSIKVISINCNGLNVLNRVKIIQSELEFLKPDLLFIQETHLHNLSYGKYLESNFFKMKSFWCLGFYNHSGTAILINNRLPF